MAKSKKPNFKVKHPYAYLIHSILLGIIVLFSGIFGVAGYNFFHKEEEVKASTVISSDWITQQDGYGAYVWGTTNTVLSRATSSTYYFDASGNAVEGSNMDSYATDSNGYTYYYTTSSALNNGSRLGIVNSSTVAYTVVFNIAISWSELNDYAWVVTSPYASSVKYFYNFAGIDKPNSYTTSGAVTQIHDNYDNEQTSTLPYINQDKRRILVL